MVVQPQQNDGNYDSIDTGHSLSKGRGFSSIDNDGKYLFYEIFLYTFLLSVKEENCNYKCLLHLLLTRRIMAVLAYM